MISLTVINLHSTIYIFNVIYLLNEYDLIYDFSIRFTANFKSVYKYNGRDIFWYS